MLSTFVVAVAIVMTGYAVSHTLRLYGRILLRLDSIDQSLALLQGRVRPKYESSPARPKLARIADGAVSKLARAGLSVGTPAPQFVLPNALSGEPVRLADCAAPFCLVFSDPQCEPCFELYRYIEEVAAEEGPLPVLLIVRGVNGDSGHAIPFSAVSLPVLVQSAWSVSREYATFKMPSAYLIDQHGTIASEVAEGFDSVSALVATLAKAPSQSVTSAPHFTSSQE